MAEGVTPTPVETAAAASRGHLLERAAPFAALVAGIAALTVYALVAARRSLSLDEAADVQAAIGPLDKVLEDALSHDPGQVAERALLHAAATVDRAEWVLRAPSLLATLVAMACVAWLGSMLGGRRAAAVAGTIFATGAGVAEVSQLARPYALGMAAVALSTCLFVRAMTGGGLIAWICYGLVAAVVPLAHPGAASVLLAHGAALVVARASISRWRVVPVAVFVALVAGLLTTASLIDRVDASGDGDASLSAVATGLGRAAAWSPLVIGLACWAVVALAHGRREDDEPWRATLLAGVALAPLAVLLAAGTGLPVFPRLALVLCAPGIAVAAGVGLAAIKDHSLFVLLAAGTAVVAALQLAAFALQPVDEDWRAAVGFVREQRAQNETVVAVPQRAKAAVAFYAPLMHVHDAARGDGAWLLLATSASDPSRLARTVVTTPRYALLDDRRFGDGLAVEHWVRP